MTTAPRPDRSGPSSHGGPWGDRPDHAAVERVASALRRRVASPSIGIILGTGLGSLAAQIEPRAVIPYADLPGFPRSTAIGHRGQWVGGRLAGHEVIAMDGRFHLYEGYSSAQITLPVHVMRALGARVLVVSNASGGLNPRFRSGEIMVLAGHVNLMGRRGGIAGCGCALPSRRGVADLYDPELARQALAAGRRLGVVCHAGVYVSVLGPNYETRAEYRFLRRIGGDAVGMSSVPEILAGAACGMRVLALSTITNVACPDAPLRVDPQEVVDIAATAEPRLRSIVYEVLRELPAE